MSAGPFEVSKYEANAGTIHNVSVQPETLAATFDATANDPPAGAVDSPFWAKISKAKSEYGLRPRAVNFRFNDGATPAGYAVGQTIQIAVMQQSVFDGINVGDAATYLSAAGTIRGKVAENLFPLS